MSGKKHKLPAPTDEQIEALAGYAAYAGNGWRRQLALDWMVAGSRWHGPYELLHQLRNSHGPRWLAGYALRGEK